MRAAGPLAQNLLILSSRARLSQGRALERLSEELVEGIAWSARGLRGGGLRRVAPVGLGDV